MIEKFLKQVTLTGADNTTNYYQLYELSEKYPFVEWGILLSKNSEGYPRFPHWGWIEGALSEKSPDVHFSGHLCGSWVRNIVDGGSDFLDAHRELSREFGRFQLNFHGQVHIPIAPENFIQSLFHLTCINKQQVIFQVDGVNKYVYSLAHSLYGRRFIDAHPLFDVSGGNGILPDKWPQPMGDYCGYAGGLSPDNLQEQLQLIQSRIRNKDGSLYPIWIDAETHIRPSDNSTFDLVLAERFLEIAKPYVLDI